MKKKKYIYIYIYIISKKKVVMTHEPPALTKTHNCSELITGLEFLY